MMNQLKMRRGALAVSCNGENNILRLEGSASSEEEI